MRPFRFDVARSVEDAVHRPAPGLAYLAGGTTLVDLMKLEVANPAAVLDINRLPLRGIRSDGPGLRIGALERMSAVAGHPAVTSGYPLLAEALRHSASPQVRNMASIGGNLLQRTRCGYFRDVRTGCNKRVPGSGCPAIEGENRTHAVLGTSDTCVATHPSDLAVALVALDATVLVHGAGGRRALPIADLYLLPGSTPDQETALRPGELITEVTVPALPAGTRSTYLKIRDRQSYEFALCSAAVALRMRGRVVREVRVAAGGVGTRPWRLPAVEDALTGRAPRPDVVAAAAAHAVDGARPLSQNRFKVLLLQRTITRAVLSLVDGRG
ncbi:FAD binding domain-containing protein [Jidongwangia harbinensis]|uniref:FAD binding domain-containing protein n=1 Tax=Jidongwangia harbinensis TaxID=2878561 RepID=UPI001CD9B517|nr:xanthine dehydrogenase family protein subunit M [Jidongwangia harbinensis]MCA2211783.1 xanthine dehydrogenase family protein subunit M [Jidongwangia harbinensis]